MKIIFRLAHNKKLKRDILIMILIIILPFLFYLHTLVPQNTKVWITQFYTFNSGYFESIDLYFWTLSIKFLTLGILSVWFVSCNKKWKYILLFPIVSELYKVFININYAENGNQNINIIDTLYVSIPYILFLLLLSSKLKFVTNKNKINKLINEEINDQLIRVSKFKSKDYKLIKKDFDLILKTNKDINEREYLAKLIALRDRLSL
ncbi:hypothetical protein [Psychroserpens mesophilus]|uniref:hypothetical protein n=1 Tax=Psychroserpens mesophilus TaxID=325473 RepID=UPI003D654E35